MLKNLLKYSSLLVQVKVEEMVIHHFFKNLKFSPILLQVEVEEMVIHPTNMDLENSLSLSLSQQCLFQSVSQ